MNVGRVKNPSPESLNEKEEHIRGSNKNETPPCVFGQRHATDAMTATGNPAASSIADTISHPQQDWAFPKGCVGAATSLSSAAVEVRTIAHDMCGKLQEGLHDQRKGKLPTKAQGNNFANPSFPVDSTNDESIDIKSSRNITGAKEIVGAVPMPPRPSLPMITPPNESGVLLQREAGVSQPKRKRSKRRGGSTWQPRKPPDKPKRPLSAYNIFFKHERDRIAISGSYLSPLDPFSVEEHSRVVQSFLSRSSGSDKTDDHLSKVSPQQNSLNKTSETTRAGGKQYHGRIGFEDLARTVAARWKCLDPSSRGVFEALAAVEKRRYQRDIDAWNIKREAKARMHLAEIEQREQGEKQDESAIENGQQDETGKYLIGKCAAGQNAVQAETLGTGNAKSASSEYSALRDGAKRAKLDTSTDSRVDPKIYINESSTSNTVREPPTGVQLSDPAATMCSSAAIGTSIHFDTRMDENSTARAECVEPPPQPVQSPSDNAAVHKPIASTSSHSCQFSQKEQLFLDQEQKCTGEELSHILHTGQEHGFLHITHPTGDRDLLRQHHQSWHGSTDESSPKLQGKEYNACEPSTSLRHDREVVTPLNRILYSSLDEESVNFLLSTFAEGKEDNDTSTEGGD